jgi:HNH endonuclease
VTQSVDFWAPRACLSAPIPELHRAADLLSGAADALLAGHDDFARDLLQEADMPALFAHARRIMGPEDPMIHRRRTVDDAGPSPAQITVRMPTAQEVSSLHIRDGWRCRFCGCRVVLPQARDRMRAALPGAIRWGEQQGWHAAFYALTASPDHVVPQAQGGSNHPDNLVTACWPCQFGRNGWSLEEVGLIDPRARPPVADGWDGLARLLAPATAAPLHDLGPAPSLPPTPERSLGTTTRRFKPARAG